MQGTIDVTEIMNFEQDRSETVERIVRRQEIDRLRREEAEVLRRYYATDEEVRQTIVQQNQVVFDRIRANRSRARAIAKAERQAVDQEMLARGYLIRSGTGAPRYVRPGWSGVLGSVRRSTDAPTRNGGPRP